MYNDIYKYIIETVLMSLTLKRILMHLTTVVKQIIHAIEFKGPIALSAWKKISCGSAATFSP